MAIAAIYIIVLAAMAFTYLGFWKEDYWLIILSSFMFISIGLLTINNGFEDITLFTYKWIFGILFLFIGVYLGSRASLEFISKSFEGL